MGGQGTSVLVVTPPTSSALLPSTPLTSHQPAHGWGGGCLGDPTPKAEVLGWRPRCLLRQLRCQSDGWMRLGLGLCSFSWPRIRPAREGTHGEPPPAVPRGWEEDCAAASREGCGGYGGSNEKMIRLLGHLGQLLEPLCASVSFCLKCMCW